jgi:hypothetical protein
MFKNTHEKPVVPEPADVELALPGTSSWELKAVLSVNLSLEYKSV